MNEQRSDNLTNTSSHQQVDPVTDITVYTDPLCCWSWGAAPHWAQFEHHLGASASWTFRMGGLLPSWAEFHDESHSVARPAQMGPLWMHAAQLTGRPTNTRLWHIDPPASSYPACVAVKAAGLQSNALARLYFEHTQQACMQDGRNVAKPETLLQLASELARSRTDFDPLRFSIDYRSDAAMDAFRHDLQQAHYHRISRLPTMVIRRNSAPGLLIAGFKTYAELISAIGETSNNGKST